MNKKEDDFYQQFNNKLQQDTLRLETPKIFWSHVEVKKDQNMGYMILLDDRPLHTPLRKKVLLPKKALAEYIAKEWKNQKDQIKPRMMPLSRLVMTVLDQLVDDENKQKEWIDMALSYLETDFLLFPSPSPTGLVAQEKKYWQPILSWAGQLLEHQFQMNEELRIASHNCLAYAQLKKYFEDYGLWQLATAVILTQMTGSVLIAFATAEKQFESKALLEAILIHEYYQLKQWGHDDELKAHITNKEFEFCSCYNFLNLL